MEIKELQRKTEEIIDKIDNKLGIKHNDNATMIHIFEELGEVANQINKRNIRNEKPDIENLGEEIADVILLTTKLASNNKICIEEAITKKLGKLKQRHNIK